MKTLPFIAALAIAVPAFAQDPAPKEEATPKAPAEETPSPDEKPAGRSEESPTEQPEKPAAPEPARQLSPDLPPLPEPAPGSEQADLLRTQPGGRLSPNPIAVPGGKKPGAGERLPGQSILRPPATSEELEQRISYRNARTRAEADPKLRALWDESRAAQTDHEKRELLKEYYKGLYAKMLSYDKSITSLIEQRRRVAVRRLDQQRIDPSIPLEDARIIGND